MTQFLDTPIDKSLSATSAWTDIDLSANVPATATGAIFQVINIDATTSRQYGFRKNGSTDNRTNYIPEQMQYFAIIGIDANRKCEGYISNTNVDFYLVGYTEEDAVFFTNAYDKSLGATGAWTDIDLSSELPAGAVAAIFEIDSTALVLSYDYGLRKKGSTDNRPSDIRASNHHFFVVGVDGSRICQGYVGNAAVDFWLVGYLIMGQAETNAIDKSLGATGSYVDIDESGNAPSWATGVFGAVISSATYSYAVRKNGVTFDKYYDLWRHNGIFSGLDANKKWEGKIENVAVDFYTMGYFSEGIQKKTSSDVGVGADAQAELLSSRLESDVGAGVDAALGVVAAISEAEIGAGADSILESLSSRLESDTGSGLDALISLLKVVAKFGSDIGSGADTISALSAALTQSDQGTGIEAIRARLICSSDVGAGMDAISELLAALSGSDEGTGLDMLSALLAEIEDSDSGTGVETSTLTILIYLLLKLLQAKGLNIALSQKGKGVNLELSQEDKGLNLKISQEGAPN